MTEAPNRTAIQVPDSIAADPRAIELIRFWWSNDEPVMAIKPAFDDPKAYGNMLALLARNVAHVYNQAKGLDEAETYKLVLAGLNEGLAKAAGDKATNTQ